MFSNYTSLGEDDFPISPISCFKLNLIALYLTMLLVASSVVNSFLAMAFLVYKELYKSVNILVLACVLLNLLGSILELPFVIGSNFACRWIFEKIGCYISAYLMYLVGCIQIYIMTAISMERYYIVRNLKILTNKTSEQSIKVLIVCFFLGFMWPTFPLIGWSNYVLEDGLTSCSVNWKDQSLNVKSYNVAIFLFVYIIPITVISICSIMSVKSIRNLPIMSTTNNSKNSKHNKIERAITIQMMIFVLIFLATWTPYAAVVIFTFLNPHSLSPMAATLPAVFAKSSMLWSSLFILVTNKNIKKIKPQKNEATNHQQTNRVVTNSMSNTKS